MWMDDALSETAEVRRSLAWRKAPSPRMPFPLELLVTAYVWLCMWWESGVNDFGEYNLEYSPSLSSALCLVTADLLVRRIYLPTSGAAVENRQAMSSQDGN